MFWASADFFGLLLNYQALWIRGALGTGKTLLAFAIAKALLETGDYEGVVSNVPHRFPRHDGTIFKRVVILDEAHQVMDSRTFKDNDRNYGAYARKTRSIWLYPSVVPIDVRARMMFCERTFRVGNLAWHYTGGVELGYTNEKFSFWLLKPASYFGLYSTGYIPIGDAGIMKLWKNTYDQALAIQDAEGGWVA